MQRTLVTKAEYARMRNREPSAVSNWIADGKITSAALEGEGVRARIWVERADADLAASLDPSQQYAQAHPILPAAPAAPAGSVALSTGAEIANGGEQEGASAAASRDDWQQRRLRADAETAEQNAIAARRKNAIEDGRWVDAAEIKADFARELSKFVDTTETFLFSTLARELADQYQLDAKAIAVFMRSAYRNFRLTAADEAKAKQEGLEAAET